MNIQTLNDVFLRTITINRPAILKYKRDGRWTDMSVPEFSDTVHELSSGLRELGVRPDDRVAIMSETRAEWTVTDFGILAANAVTVPIYPTLLENHVEFILKDSGAVGVFVSTDEQVQKILSVKDNCPALRFVVSFDATATAGVMSLKDVRERGRSRSREDFERLLRQRKPEDLATIVYTSGTTGMPKGAMLTHGNVASNIIAACAVLPFDQAKVAFAFLPLSHIFERMADVAYLITGATIAFAENITKIGDNLQEVKPSVFAAAPRIFEKLRARIMDSVASQPESKQKIFRWALSVGEARLPYRVAHQPVPLPLRLKGFIADKLVFRKILGRLGGRIRFVVSGSAPLSQELAAFFIGAGLEVYEGYGLTETSPVISVNTPSNRKLGTVGKPVPGVEVKIAPDGEILTRGPHVMKGYFNNPKATAEVIDDRGWFHTGDIGLLDPDGYLKITDRKKDIIVTAYGKNVAPQYVEEALKRSPYIGTPVVLGDRRQFITALVVPNFERLEQEAQTLGIRAASRSELAANSRVRDLIKNEIDRINSQLAPFEQVRQFAVVPEDFTVESGLLTPSFKVKRRQVEEKYKSIIDSMYEGPGSRVPGPGSAAAS